MITIKQKSVIDKPKISMESKHTIRVIYLTNKEDSKRKKRAGDLVQWFHPLPHKHKGPSSIPNTKKKRKEKNCNKTRK